MRRLSLFGSVLREDFGEGSDIDVLVESVPGHVPGPIRLAGLELEVGEILGRKVDLVTPRSVCPCFRDRVRNGAVLLHDAA